LDSPNPGRGIQILIVSPTRELATQIFNQAKLMTQHHTHMSIQIIMGGTNQKSDVTKFNRVLPTILVATPGRLKDHLQNTKLNGTPFATAAVSQLKVLILDEADQLLEMGFRPDILLILKYLPPVDRRQTLLFSATVPKELVAVMGAAMKPKYQTVDCIHDDSKDGSNNSKETNAHVLQSYAVLSPGTDRLVSSVVETILAAIQGEEQGFKIIAFFSTARLVGFFSDLFNHGIVKHQYGKTMPHAIPNVIEIHSRKSQSARNKASDLFRASTGRSILFTSDVSARGVDYPNVSHGKK
jgi:ATP-dependent RNA helicase MSS116